MGGHYVSRDPSPVVEIYAAAAGRFQAEGERGGAHAATTHPACIIDRFFDADDRG